MLEHLAAAQRFAVRLAGGDVARAEDLLHDAIVRAVARFESFRGQSKFTTWLFAIIVNVWRDRLAASQRTEEPIEAEPVDLRQTDPLLRYEASEMSDAVVRAISNLPSRQREVLILVAYEQLRAGEAADVLGITEENVRVNLFHARANLKRDLAAYLNEESRDRRGSTAR